MPELVLEHEAKQKLIVLAGLLAACLAFALMAVSIAEQNLFMLIALMAIAGFVVSFPFPRMGILLVILFAQVQYVFTTEYGTLFSRPIFPMSFQWLDEVILLCLLGNLILTRLLKKEGPEKSPGLIILTALFMVGFVSTRLNEISLLRGFIGQRYIFEMVIVYLAVINMNLDERFLRRLVYLLLGIGVFQAMIGFLEFLAKYSLYMSGNHDIVQGTWGGGAANNIGVFFLCLASIVLARLRRGVYGPRAVLFGIFVVLLVLTSSRSAIVLSPLAFLFILRDKLKDPRYWLGTAIALIFLAASLSFYYRNTDAEVTKDLGADEFVFQFSGRTSVIPVMSQVLRDNSKFPLFGTGPGTYLTPTGTFYGSSMYIQVESMLRTREVIGPFISASYAVVWMEYGIVGLILFGLVLFRLFVFAWRQERVIDSFFWKDYFRALQVIIAVYALVGGVFPLWTHFQASIYLWLFPAIGIRYAIVRRQEALEAAHEVSEQEEGVPRRLQAAGPFR